jgi:hypothetical protein
MTVIQSVLKGPKAHELRIFYATDLTACMVEVNHDYLTTKQIAKICRHQI